MGTAGNITISREGHDDVKVWHRWDGDLLMHDLEHYLPQIDRAGLTPAEFADKWKGLVNAEFIASMPVPKNAHDQECLDAMVNAGVIVNPEDMPEGAYRQDVTLDDRGVQSIVAHNDDSFAIWYTRDGAS